MAKYAVLSDIHGNADAFEAVLAKCAEIAVDKYICLGDVVGYNAEPSRCIQMAKELNFIAQVRGNHDEYAVRGAPELSGFNENAKIAIMWTRHQLSDDELDWLDSFTYCERVMECGATIVHATLDTPESWGYIFDGHHAQDNFHYQYTPLCFCGHSHVPVAFDKAPINNFASRNANRIAAWEVNEYYPETNTDFRYSDELQVRLEKGHKYLFNIGSIGQPRNGDPRASFAVLDTDLQIVTRYRVPYDVASAQEKIRAAGLPERLAARLAIGH